MPTPNKPHYCTTDDVKRYFPQSINSSTIATARNPSPIDVKDDEITYYIEQAGMIIQGYLQSIYDVPLKKINQGGDIDYPYPITQACAAMTANMIYQRKVKSADISQYSELAKNDKEVFEGLLTKIQNGEIVLLGQRALKSSRFVKNTLYPAPLNPAQGGRTRRE